MSSSEAPVDLAAYDPSWPGRFKEEKTALLRTLAPWLVGPTHHLHLIPVCSPRWIAPIAFRDYLRAHSEVAAEYGDLKRLAEQYRFDREAYTEAKSPFVEWITGLALAERQKAGA